MGAVNIKTKTPSEAVAVLSALLKVRTEALNALPRKGATEQRNALQSELANIRQQLAIARRREQSAEAIVQNGRINCIILGIACYQQLCELSEYDAQWQSVNSARTALSNVVCLLTDTLVETKGKTKDAIAKDKRWLCETLNALDDRADFATNWLKPYTYCKEIINERKISTKEAQELMIKRNVVTTLRQQHESVPDALLGEISALQAKVKEQQSKLCNTLLLLAYFTATLDTILQQHCANVREYYRQQEDNATISVLFVAVKRIRALFSEFKYDYFTKGKSLYNAMPQLIKVWCDHVVGTKIVKDADGYYTKVCSSDTEFQDYVDSL